MQISKNKCNTYVGCGEPDRDHDGERPGDEAQEDCAGQQGQEAQDTAQPQIQVEGKDLPLLQADYLRVVV